MKDEEAKTKIAALSTNTERKFLIMPQNSHCVCVRQSVSDHFICFMSSGREFSGEKTLNFFYDWGLLNCFKRQKIMFSGGW